VLIRHLFQVRAENARKRIRIYQAWSQWQKMIRCVRAFQRWRLRLLLSRKFFMSWAAVTQFERAVLAALSVADVRNHESSSSQFVRVRPQAHSFVQTARPLSNPSLPGLIHRFVMCSLVPFFLTWKKSALRSRAVRWDIKRTFARVMKVWTHQRKPSRATDDQHIDSSAFIDDDQRWRQLISPQRYRVTDQYLGLVSSIAASSPSKNNSTFEVTSRQNASRR
jgi:hypothetical protein